MVNLISNLLITCLIGSLLFLLLNVINEMKEQKKMFGEKVTDIDKKIINTNNKLLIKYQKRINKVLAEKKMEKYTQSVFYGIILSSIVLILYFTHINQLFLAILAPLGLNIFIFKLLAALEDDIDGKMEEQLPTVIDTMIRIFSKYGDLKSVIYETSLIIENPLGKKYEELSRKMVSDSSQEKAMMDFAENLNNIWIYSMFSILVSYKEDASKEDTINNLRNLRDIIEKENEMKNDLVSNNRLGVGINYFICAAAFIASIGNILFNPIGKEFFFSSFNGIVCFIVGYVSLFITVILNIGMSKKERKKV